MMTDLFIYFYTFYDITVDEFLKVHFKEKIWSYM